MTIDKNKSYDTLHFVFKIHFEDILLQQYSFQYSIFKVLWYANTIII